MYRINVIASFPGAHHLDGYEGACRNLHGHNWRVRVQLVADMVDACGMAIDFGIVKRHLNDLIARFDHQYLNKLVEFKDKNPTSENIARVIFTEMQARVCVPPHSDIRVSEVEVWESDITSIIYSEL